jgi:hypothetical protein
MVQERTPRTRPLEMMREAFVRNSGPLASKFDVAVVVELGAQSALCPKGRSGCS